MTVELELFVQKVEASNRIASKRVVVIAGSYEGPPGGQVTTDDQMRFECDPARAPKVRSTIKVTIEEVLSEPPQAE